MGCKATGFNGMGVVGRGGVGDQNCFLGGRNLGESFPKKELQHRLF